MLKKSYRLQKRDLERLFKKGRVIRQDTVLARFGPNRTDHSRYAVIISKKILAKATARNRLRRRVFEWLSQNQEQWQNQHLDIAFWLKATEADKIKLALAKLWPKIT